MTPYQLILISEPLERMYADVNSALIVNLAKHIGSEIDYAINWETKKLSEFGAVNKESIEIISQITGKKDVEIKNIFAKVFNTSVDEVDNMLEEAVKKGALQKPYKLASENVNRILDAYVESAVSDTNLVNTVMLQSTQQRYIQAVQNTWAEAQQIEQLLNVQNAQGLAKQLNTAQNILNQATFSQAVGTQSLRTAQRNAVKALVSKGITGFVDSAGRQWSPEAYVAMDLRTTANNVYIQARKTESEQYGVDTFQISTKAIARPLCAPYQGWICSWENRRGIVTDGNGNQHTLHAIDDTSYGEPAGIFGINCGHTPITFVEGFSIPRDDEITPEELEKNNQRYELTQEQRAMERQIRKLKTEAMSLDELGDKEAFDETALKIKEKTAGYRKFCKDHDLKVWDDRLQTYSYDKDIERKVNAVKSPQKTTTQGQGVGRSVNNVINGKDISDTWERRPEQFDFEIKDIINAQGFDGKPRVVSADEFDAAVKESNFVAQRTYSAPDQETLDKYRDQLYYGDWYVDCTVGGAQYGQGMYCAADYNGVLTQGIAEEMQHYQDIYKNLAETTDEVRLNYLHNLAKEQGLTEQEEKYLIYRSGLTQTAGLRWKDMIDPDILNKDVVENIEKRLVNDVLTYKLPTPSYVETLTLDPSAKVITFDDLRNKKHQFVDAYFEQEINKVLSGMSEVEEAAFRYVNLIETKESRQVFEDFKWDGDVYRKSYRDMMEENREKWKSLFKGINEKRHDLELMDDGAFAALLGYDAINAEGHGASGSYTVILNRTKVIFKGE